MYLRKILDSRRRRGGEERLGELKQQALAASPVRDFCAALREGAFPTIIAEIKRASPSRGPLRSDLDPAEMAAAYEAGGAGALSVLTEELHFQGSLEDLKRARQACRLPVLRKDFLLKEWEVYESRAAGADAVLLIAAALDEGQLGRMLALARELGMVALVEVHSEQELEQVLPLGPRVVGINNRNLETFVVDRETTRRLAARIGHSALKVSESGFSLPEELEQFPEIDAFLVGESLVTSADPEQAVRTLRGAGKKGAS